MKVGDLGELSSYGKRLKMMRKYVGDIGVISQAKLLPVGVPHTISYQVMWFKAGKAFPCTHFERKDLKYAKTRN